MRLNLCSHSTHIYSTKTNTKTSEAKYFQPHCYFKCLYLLTVQCFTKKVVSFFTMWTQNQTVLDVFDYISLTLSKKVISSDTLKVFSTETSHCQQISMYGNERASLITSSALFECISAFYFKVTKKVLLCECVKKNKKTRVDYLTAAVSASLHVIFCAIPALSSAPWKIHLEFNFTHQEFSRDKEG